MSTIDDFDTRSHCVLQNLIAFGNEGSHTVDYILHNHVNIVIVDNDARNLWWKVKISLRGLRLQNTLFVSRYIANMPPDDPWVLMEFVHETRHLEQGFWTAFSVYGEMEAWQLGFRFYKSLPNCQPLSDPIEKLLTLTLSHEVGILKEAQRLINEDQNEGTNFKEQLRSVVSKEKRFHQVYWIKALPLNPLLSKA
jgi:hypothetical protein